MAVAQAEQEQGWAELALPYGAAALVTAAAIISAWPVYVTPAFPQVALTLVFLGTPTSMYLRRAGTNRRLLNLSIAAAALAYVYAMLRELPLAQAQGDIFRFALLMDDREAMAVIIQTFVTVAMFRSFTLLTDRDLALTIVPALSTILLAAILNRGPLIIIGLLLFFIGALYLLAFEHQERWAAQARARQWLEQKRRRRLLAWLAGRLWLMLVPMVVAAALLFAYVNLPRTLMLRYGPQADLRLMMRFYQLAMPTWIVPTDRIELGSGYRLRNRILFKVDATEGALWRATTLDTYTGHGWETTVAPLLHPQRLALKGDQWIVQPQDPGLRASVPVPSRDLEQVFHLQVPMQGIMLAAYEPKAVSGLLRRPGINRDSVLTEVAPMRAGEVYRVISRRKSPPGAAVYRAGVKLPEADRNRFLFLDLPAIPRRTQRLALRITANEPDNLHKALALAAYLGSKYSYRETVTPPPRKADFVTEFLFKMKGGYCDYFASALAVMARVNGIPSRVVTGYRSAEEEENTGWWVVREKGAHSWVEVFLDGYGWFELDPSPIPDVGLSMLERVQRAMGGALAAVRAAVRAPFAALVRQPGWQWKSSLVVVGLTLVALGIRYLLREKVPLLPGAAGADQLRQYVRTCYRRMCRWLGGWGLPKPPGATASEYAASLDHALGTQAEPMRDVIKAYLGAEYGGRRFEHRDAAGVGARLEAVLALRKALLRQRRKSARSGPAN